MGKDKQRKRGLALKIRVTFSIYIKCTTNLNGARKVVASSSLAPPSILAALGDPNLAITPAVSQGVFGGSLVGRGWCRVRRADVVSAIHRAGGDLPAILGKVESAASR